VAKPVVTSELKGPIMGTLFFGRNIDASFVARLAELTKLELSMKVSGELPHHAALSENTPTLLQNIDDNVMRGTTLFLDKWGKPALVVDATIPRDIMIEGRKTISLFTRLVAGLGAVFALLLVFAVDRTIVARLVRLSTDVKAVGPKAQTSGQAAQVAVVGKDEIGSLATEINSMLTTIASRSRAIRDIVDNVSFGFLVVDSNTRIQPGFTQSCSNLLGLSPEAIEGRALTTVLRMNRKDTDWFQVLFGQLFEDILPEETSLSQLPSRITLTLGESRRAIHLDGRVLRDEISKVPRGVLFSLSDVTELEKAEQENLEARTLIKIMRAPIAFHDFIADCRTHMRTLESSLASGNQVTVRRVLHTLKGNFGCFDLLNIVQEIHHIEEKTEIEKSDVLRVESLIKAFLAANSAVLKINYEQDSPVSHVVADQDLVRLESLAKSDRLTLEQKNAAIVGLVQEMRRKPFREVAGPIDEMVQQTAARLGKTVEFAFSGGDLRVDLGRLKPVVEVLPHLLRNAIDHGIETSEVREDSGKSPIAKIELSVADEGGSGGVVITVSDDGRGINTKLVGERAVKMGLVTDARLRTMTDHEIAMLIFSDRLSTASEVSDISGRGVGMSAVLDAVQRCSGTLEIGNLPGRGCRFQIKVPHVVKPAFQLRKAG